MFLPNISVLRIMFILMILRPIKSSDKSSSYVIFTYLRLIFKFFAASSLLSYNSWLMSLFIGNVSKKVTHQEFEDAFKAFGNCKIDLRKRYAFVQFESERCAEEARQALQNTNFSGLRLNIEWSKNSGRFNENTRSKNDRSRRRRSNSPERSWRKEDRMFRRSPSFEKRHAPTYSDNQDDLETFVSKSPRDAELIKRLRSRREEGEMTEREARPVLEREASRPPMQLQAGETI